MAADNEIDLRDLFRQDLVLRFTLGLGAAVGQADDKVGFFFLPQLLNYLAGGGDLVLNLDILIPDEITGRTAAEESKTPIRIPAFSITV